MGWLPVANEGNEKPGCSSNGAARACSHTESGARLLCDMVLVLDGGEQRLDDRRQVCGRYHRRVRAAAVHKLEDAACEAAVASAPHDRMKTLVWQKSLARSFKAGWRILTWAQCGAAAVRVHRKPQGWPCSLCCSPMVQAVVCRTCTFWSFMACKGKRFPLRYRLTSLFRRSTRMTRRTFALCEQVAAHCCKQAGQGVMEQHLQKEVEAQHDELRQLIWRRPLQDAAKHEGGRFPVPPVIRADVFVDVRLQTGAKQRSRRCTAASCHTRECKIMCPLPCTEPPPSTRLGQLCASTCERASQQAEETCRSPAQRAR